MSGGGEMVERVARAIVTAQLTRQYVGKVRGVTAAYEIDRIWPEFVAEARAAVAAMREPTEAMVEAAWASALAEDAEGVWLEMIDAALSGSGS